MKRRIFLASTSPRRKQLLNQIGIEVEVHGSEYEEDMSAMTDPRELAKFLALNKVEDVAKHYDDEIIIGADTFIVFENKFLGKPGSCERAKEMLRFLSGNEIEIITGFAIIDKKNNKTITDIGEAKAKIKELSEAEIDKYVATGEPIDRAGAYVAQEIGAIFTEKIDGDFSAIVGLPLNKVYLALQDLGVDILD